MHAGMCVLHAFIAKLTEQLMHCDPQGIGLQASYIKTLSYLKQGMYAQTHNYVAMEE